jgi:uncharacterized repeat protein (TIGR02543 family)
MNKTINKLSLRAAALLAVLVLTILAAPSEAKAQGGGVSTDFYNLTLYDNYDGGGAQTIHDISSGSNITPPAPTREYFYFMGWATTETGDVVYAPDAEITIDRNLTLYAKWAETSKNYIVSFNANGGSGMMVPVAQAKRSEYTIPACGYTRDGYGFIGWATSADGEVVYNPGTVITLTNNLTLYAKWADANENYIVSFNANGGSGMMAAVALAKRLSEYTFPACGFTRSSYRFIGWATSADGEVVYQPGHTKLLFGNQTFYAKWEAITSGTCGLVNQNLLFDGTEVTWSLTKSEGSADYDVLTISSSIVNGYMANYDDGGSPWYAYRDQIKTIVIEDGVRTIGYRAFKDCTGAISVSFGNSVKDINIQSFQGCTGLKSVTIGNGVTNIDYKAFGGCIQLSSVTIYATSVPSNGGAFLDNDDGLKIYVLVDKVGEYKIASGWSDYASAIEPLDVIIEDGNDKSVLTNGQTKNIALKRTFPRGKKQTVCLPFAPTELLNHGKVWQFTGISEEGGVKKAVMTEVTSGPLSANTPYIFEATSDVWSMTFGEAEVNISEYPETVDATAGFTFHGTYVKKHWDANDDDVKNGHIYGFLMEDSEDDPTRKEGMFVKAKYNTNVRPFSCYLEYNGELTGTETTARRKASAEELPDVIEIEWKSAAEAPGEATGIDELRIKNLELRDEGWYSLDGRRLSGRPTAKGLYIHNGKLVIKN